MKVFDRSSYNGQFPYGPIIAVCCVTFLDQFSQQLITPTIPFIVKSFYPDLNDTELGYYAGYLNASFSLGNIPGSLFWGWYADRVGRRNCFLTTLTGVFILSNLFGISPNYALAIVFRALWGFFQGNVGPAKTYISEVCTPKQQALGFSLFIAAAGISNFVGPTVGGLLSNSDTNFPALVKAIPFLKQYKFYLPCFVASILMLCVFFEVLFIVPETLTKKQIKVNDEMKHQTKKLLLEVTEKQKKDPNYMLSEKEIEIKLWGQDNYISVIKNKDVLISASCYCYLTSGNCVAFIFSSPLLLPQLSRLFNYTTIFTATSILFGLLLWIAPVSGIMTESPEWSQWFVTNFLYGLALGIRILASKVNGFAQVCSAFGRTIGPILGTNLFAWSIAETRSFPFDYGFAFYADGLLSIISSCIPIFMRKDINCPPPSVSEYAHTLYINSSKDVELQVSPSEDIINETKTETEDMKNDHNDSKKDTITNTTLEEEDKAKKLDSQSFSNLNSTSHQLETNDTNNSINHENNIPISIKTTESSSETK
ncbi:hypothetical protein WA158_001186 [Blastocystis sp. Blastoise]